VRKISPPLGSDLRSDHLVASRYAVYVIPTPNIYVRSKASKHTHTHTHTHTHIYTDIYIYRERERGRERDIALQKNFLLRQQALHKL